MFLMKHVVKLASPMGRLGYFERMDDRLNFGANGIKENGKIHKKYSVLKPKTYMVKIRIIRIIL